MESNLLINHPASLDTVTALKRRQWCIASVHLRITVYGCDSTEALNTLYLEPWRDVHLCISQFIYLRCDGSWRAIILLPASAFIQIPTAFQPPVCFNHTDFWLWMRRLRFGIILTLASAIIPKLTKKKRVVCTKKSGIIKWKWISLISFNDICII